MDGTIAYVVSFFMIWMSLGVPALLTLEAEHRRTFGEAITVGDLYVDSLVRSLILLAWPLFVSDFVSKKNTYLLYPGARSLRSHVLWML